MGAVWRNDIWDYPHSFKAAGPKQAATSTWPAQATLTCLSQKGSIAHRFHCYFYLEQEFADAKKVPEMPGWMGIFANSNSKYFIKSAICLLSGWFVPSSQARIDAVAIPIF